MENSFEYSRCFCQLDFMKLRKLTSSCVRSGVKELRTRCTSDTGIEGSRLRAWTRGAGQPVASQPPVAVALCVARTVSVSLTDSAELTSPCK